MSAVASRLVVAPVGSSRGVLRDGRVGRVFRHAPATSRRARFVADAAADVVELPEKQEAIDDAGVKPGSLTRAVMAVEDDSAEAMFECILEWATETKNMELYEAQEEAIMELVEGNSVLLTTPTGSGKTLVATAAIAAATARGDVRTREIVRMRPRRAHRLGIPHPGPHPTATRRLSVPTFRHRAAIVGAKKRRDALGVDARTEPSCFANLTRFPSRREKTNRLRKTGCLVHRPPESLGDGEVFPARQRVRREERRAPHRRRVREPDGAHPVLHRGGFSQRVAAARPRAGLRAGGGG